MTDTCSICGAPASESCHACGGSLCEACWEKEEPAAREVARLRTVLRKALAAYRPYDPDHYPEATWATEARELLSRGNGEDV